ncbi:hypothetical protein FOL79_02820 [Lactobacillus reuteri]|nr:hypothetical protein [Limosilactobacillus reuteri]
MKMKIKEFIEKVNEHDGMMAKEVDKEIIIGTPNNMGIFSIPEDATNFIEIYMWAVNNSMYWKKADREYLSTLIEEFLHTPVKERFPEKKYYLCVFPKKEALEWSGESEAIWVNHIESFDDGFRIDYGPKTAFTEETLNTIEESLPFIAPTIEAMKKPVEDIND